MNHLASHSIDVSPAGNSIPVGVVGRQQRSLENPRVPLSQAIGDDWDSVWDTGRSDSGITVSRKAALSLSGFFRGVSRISRDVAKIPVFVYGYTGENKFRDREHPAHPLLRKKSNPEMTAFTVRQTMQMHVLVRGNAYGYIVRDGAARPLEIWPLDPDHTWPVRVDGQLLYITEIISTDAAGKTVREMRKLPARDVLHIKGISWDGLVGENVIKLAANSLGLSLANRKYASKFFVNSGGNRIVIECPAELNDKAAARLREGWERMTSGLNNSHRTVVLEQGAKANNLSVNARDAQLVETMDASLTDVANWLGLPVHMVGGKGRTAYASLEQENQSYLDDALDGWFTCWEAETNDKLLTEKEKSQETRFIEFVRQALVRANLQTRYAAYQTAVNANAPWLSDDEIRGFENLNPFTDEQRKKLPRPLNMAPKTPADPPPSDPPANDEAIEAARDNLREVIARMVRRLQTHADKALRDQPSWEAFRTSAKDEHLPAIAAALNAPCRILRAIYNDPQLTHQRIAWSVFNGFLASYDNVVAGDAISRERAAHDATFIPLNLVPKS